MIGYDPCGYAVDMLRSCYSTDCRFYNHDGIIDNITWYFVPPGTPFLPVPSVINSLEWVDQKDRIDHGDAGEVPGAARSYVKGARDVSLRAAAYCGTAADWLGNGTRPTVPPPLGQTGNPACCGPADSNAVPKTVYIGVRVWTSNIDPGGSDGTGVSISSNLAFYSLVDLGDVRMQGSLRYDLFYAKGILDGHYDDIADFGLLDFNGYAYVYAYPWAINPVGALPDQEMDNTVHFEQTGVNPGGVHNSAIGMVCSDEAGSVWWYWDFLGPAMVFLSPGDYVDFVVPWQALASYP